MFQSVNPTTSFRVQTLGSALDFLEETSEDEAAAEVDHEFDIFQIYEESPDIEIPYDLIAELEEKELAAAAARKTPQSEINGANIKAAVLRWRLHDKDCGSAEVVFVYFCITYSCMRLYL